MGSISGNVVALLQFLLPGFVTAWIFYGLTSNIKPSQFERVVQALIFTLLIQPIVILLKFLIVDVWTLYSLEKWSDNITLIASITIAVLLGLIFSDCVNNDRFHGLIRKLGISKETSYPSEWFGSFLKPTFIVLHLEDERRIYGWPMEWPSHPKSGHFVIAEPSWLLGHDEQRIEGAERIMIDVNDVKWVEFMENTWEINNG